MKNSAYRTKKAKLVFARRTITLPAEVMENGLTLSRDVRYSGNFSALVRDLLIERMTKAIAAENGGEGV